MLALRPPPPARSAWAAEGLALAGLALILFAVFTYTEATPFPGLTALPPCVGTALLIATVAGAFVVASAGALRILQLRRRVKRERKR